MTLRTWPLWLGITGTLIVATCIALFVGGVLLDGTVPADHIAVHEPIQRWLRIAFLLIALGMLWRLPTPISRTWRWTVGAAVSVLACALVVEITGRILNFGFLLDDHTVDSLERRLSRLGAMAAYAVPMLALVAAAEPKPGTVSPSSSFSEGIATLLVRWEPVLFAIGATTLAGLLLAAAFIDHEFTWAAPIGADTTVAACAAATIRARRRDDGLAFASWLLICAGLAIGLLMGIYSFGGPVQVPGFVGDYNALPRVLLRDGHVLILAIGIVGIAIAATRQPREGLT